MKIPFGIILLLLLGTVAATVENFDSWNIIDITHPIRNDMPSFDSKKGAGNILNETYGAFTVTGNFRMSTHLGSHVDCPAHIFQEQHERGVTVDSLDLRTLMGPVLVIEVPPDTNITTEVVRSFNISQGVKRVIFKTQNTNRKLMQQQEFAGDYTGFTVDGAQELVKNTEIKFVGIDYMSVARNGDVVAVHQALLGDSRGIIPVENLKLDDVKPGPYTVYCLPLRLLAEAAPVRCILVA
ncbi:hypothetical protein ACH5RR_002215 [Cinchona calisaya]|uniref:Uncharacterized protein n=1 Tax=Cinchona calisaya TaxID=153742 RepID=A0ABD3B700_9GENT